MSFTNTPNKSLKKPTLGLSLPLTDTNNPAKQFNDNLDVIDQQFFADVSTLAEHTDFAAAITAIGGATRTLIIPTVTASITSNVTVPSNVTLKFTGTGQLNVGSGFTVTINGPLDAPLKQIFSGAGSIAFSSGALHIAFPQWWGAKGDGTTDDTTSFQSCFDAVATGGGATVRIPAGTYIVTPLNVRANTNLIGSGQASILKLKDAYNLSNNLVKVENENNVLLANFRVDGNRANNTGNQYPVFVSTSTDSLVDNVHAFNGRGVGIHIFDCVRTFVRNSVSWGNIFHGMEIEDSLDCGLIGNISHANDQSGFLIYEGLVTPGCTNIIVIGNIGHTNTNQGLKIEGKACQNMIVANNVFRDNLDFGMQILEPGDPFSGLQVIGNQIINNGLDGINCKGMSHAIIAFNHLINNSSRLDAWIELRLEVFGASKYSTNNMIYGNKIQIDAGVNRADWAIKENSANDGPNYFWNNIVDSGDVGSIGPIHVSSEAKDNIGYVTENSGRLVGSGNGATTVFVFSHNLDVTPATVIVSAGHVDSDGDFYATADATNITVTFATAPITGTNNVVLDWIARSKK